MAFPEPRRSTRGRKRKLNSPSISTLLAKFKTGTRPKKSDDDDEKESVMACTAVLTSSRGRTYEGAYTSGDSQHAEMNAISALIAAGGTLAQVTKIVISSPPCSACALMLSAFNLTAKVQAGETYKDFTGSWRLPDNLRDTALIVNATVLGNIRACYGVSADDAGADAQIFETFWDDVGKKLD
jgi:deoxycytidylate deaminase